MNEEEIKQIAACVIDELKKIDAVQTDPLAGRIFFSTGEMAKMCGIHLNTWIRWVRKGRAPAPVLIGNARRWLKDDIEKWKKRLKKESLGVGI